MERAEALDRNLQLDGEDELTPILLAVSDNGSQMISVNTRKFMAMFAIAQHFGRQSTPTDQAWVESLNGTVKTEWPHLTRITDPAVLRAELETIRIESRYAGDLGVSDKAVAGVGGSSVQEATCVRSVSGPEPSRRGRRHGGHVGARAA